MTTSQPSAVSNTAQPFFVVLDDDPTGTQSVADVLVMSRWEVDDFRWALEQTSPAVYILTNSRSLDPDSAARINEEVVTNALAAAADSARSVVFVSRGDSTLRGHYPLETDVIAHTLQQTTGETIDAVLLVPAFPAAGRVTLGGIHYMRSATGLTPVAETEFAADATFGYRSSDLADYVAEKTEGRFRADQVLKLSIETIHAGPEAIAAALAPLSGGTPVVVDIITEQDLRRLAEGLDLAEAAGKRLLYRVGPPFVRARIGQDPRPPLRREHIFSNTDARPASAAPGGLIVVGSHVGLTSRQLAVLQQRAPVAATLEIDIEQVLDSARSQAHLAEIIASAADGLSRGDVVVHTSRTLKRTDDADESLEIARRVSAAVVEVVRGVLAAQPPRFVIAKGGITSSDVAAHGLEIGRALVRGSLLPGIVSLWEPVSGPAQGIPYVVFAGNVGDDESLADVVHTLSSAAS